MICLVLQLHCIASAIENNCLHLCISIMQRLCVFMSVCVRACDCVYLVALRCLGNSHYRICYLFLKLGVILAIVVAFTSHRQQPPAYHWVGN